MIKYSVKDRCSRKYYEVYQGLWKYNITLSELPTILRSVSLSSETSNANRFPRFKEVFPKQKFILLLVISKNDSEKRLFIFRNIKCK